MYIKLSFEGEELGLWCFTPLSQQYFSCIVVVSFIGGENRSTRENHRPSTCLKSLINLITYCCIKYTLPSTGFKLITLVEIGIDCIGRCRSNYYRTTTKMALNSPLNK